MQCKVCNQVKIPDAFYSSNRSTCKDCVKVRVRRNRKDNAEYYRAYDRARASLPERVLLREKTRKQRREDPIARASDTISRVQWAQTNAIKRRAHITTGNAIRAGKLTPQPCERCGHAINVQAHHEDYTKPLDVNWLCPPCHGARHREINEERRSAA